MQWCPGVLFDVDQVYTFAISDCRQLQDVAEWKSGTFQSSHGSYDSQLVHNWRTPLIRKTVMHTMYLKQCLFKLS